MFWSARTLLQNLTGIENTSENFTQMHQQHPYQPVAAGHVQPTAAAVMAPPIIVGIPVVLLPQNWNAAASTQPMQQHAGAGVGIQITRDIEIRRPRASNPGPRKLTIY